MNDNQFFRLPGGIKRNWRNLNDQLSPTFKIFVALFFVTLVAIGLNTYKDYGISIDENFQRKHAAISAIYINYKLNYLIFSKEKIDRLIREDINDENYKAKLIENHAYLEEYPDADHGVFIHMVFIAVEYLLNLKGSRDAFFFRHILVYFLFLFSLFLFFKLISIPYKSGFLGIVGVLLLITSPRIFGHSFINSKDIPFLSFYIISAYTLLKYLKNKNTSNAFLHALSSSLLISVRIPGVIIPLITMIMIITDAVKQKKIHKYLISNYKSIVVYVISTIVLVVLMYPYLWENPVKGFLEIAGNNIRFERWDFEQLFFGKYLKVNDIPFYYIPAWIGITTPVLYLVFCIIGIGIIVKRIFKQSYHNCFNELYDITMILLFMVPLFLVIILDSIVYNGWRHMYFIYPPLLIIGIKGFYYIFKKIRHVKILRAIFIITVIANFIYLFNFLIKSHPYQYVFFNSVINKEKIAKNFEIDYWALSYRKALEYILETDERDKVNICFNWRYLGAVNKHILNEDFKNRYKIESDAGKADYFITNFYPAFHSEIHDLYLTKEEVYSISINGYKLCGVYKLN